MPGVVGLAIEWNKLKLKLSVSVADGYTLSVARYNADGLVSDKNCDFMKEPRFVEAYDQAMKQSSTPSFKGHWHIHVTTWAAAHASQLSGDFVECGVFRGMMAMATMTYTRFHELNRKYYLFDTFCGLDAEYCTPAEYATYIGQYPDTFELVTRRFAPFPNVVIVKGPVPATLSRVEISKVAYLHLDMNCTMPEIAAFKHFWPRMVQGGIVVLDDYGWPGHESQKESFDELAKSYGVEILSLPTGQGVILKP